MPVFTPSHTGENFPEEQLSKKQLKGGHESKSEEIKFRIAEEDISDGSAGEWRTVSAVKKPQDVGRSRIPPFSPK